MKVFFTDHAKMRCRQRKIDPEHIRRRLADIPKCVGTFKWRLGKLCVTISVSNDAVLVITVYEKSKRRVG